MRGRIVSALIVLIVLAAPCVSSAGGDGHREATLKLLGLFNMEQMLDQTIDNMLELEMQQNPELGLYEDVMKRFFAKYMSWESLKEDFVKMYMEEFTEKEVRDMIKFYETPTGQKAIEKTPVLVAKGAQLGQQRVVENIEELQRMLEEEIARLKEMKEKGKE